MLSDPDGWSDGRELLHQGPLLLGELLRRDHVDHHQLVSAAAALEPFCRARGRGRWLWLAAAAVFAALAALTAAYAWAR